jgi:hypothetical protein
MSSLDAAKRLALKQEGGIAGLAARMGMNPNTLAHKLAAQSGHNFFLREAELMTALTSDAEIAQAMALACGHVCIPVAATTSGALAGDIAAAGQEFGDVMRATLEAIADNRVTKRELAEYDRQFQEFLAVAVALRGKLAAMMPKGPDLKVAG